MVVDDYFPYNEESENWACSRSNGDREIWVLLLEKAWAKIHGSYQRIEGGTTDDPLTALTGAPTKTYIHTQVKDQETLWKNVY